MVVKRDTNLRVIKKQKLKRVCKKHFKFLNYRGQQIYNYGLIKM